MTRTSGNYCKPRVLGLFFLLGMTCLFFASGRAEEPANVGQQGPSGTGKKEGSPVQNNVDAAILRIVSAGAVWRAQAAREAQSDDSLGKKAFDYLREILRRNDLAEDKNLQQRMKVCLFLLQFRPVEESIATLDKVLTSERVKDPVRVEALVTIYRQRGGVEYVKQKLNIQDDRTKASAIRALARVQNDEEIRTMISELKQSGTDFTGTHTGRAIGEAQSRLYLSRHLSSMKSYDDRLMFLLDNLPYEPTPPPGQPRLAEDPVSIFQWDRLVDLWKEDSSHAQKVIEKYKSANPERERSIKMLLRDLSAVAN